MTKLQKWKKMRKMKIKLEIEKLKKIEIKKLKKENAELRNKIDELEKQINKANANLTNLLMDMITMHKIYSIVEKKVLKIHSILKTVHETLKMKGGENESK